MKIQRDNTKVALTQEMKDQAFKEQQEKIKEAERKLEKRIKHDKERLAIQKEQKEAQDQFTSIVQPIGKRQMAYPTMSEQLDMLWHDMDEGRIKIDKRKKNTWYHKIKEIKKAIPISKTWREDSYAAQLKMIDANQRIANNNMQGV